MSETSETAVWRSYPDSGGSSATVWISGISKVLRDTGISQGVDLRDTVVR